MKPLRANYKNNPLEYRAWADMKTRCYNKKFKDFHLYGGKGIVVCKSWRDSFTEFYNAVGPKPTPRHTLDRYPNSSGNYEPGNVRWATPKEQARNWSVRNRLIAFRGQVKPLSQWAEELGIARVTIRDRLKTGWTIERALTVPTITKRIRNSRGVYVKTTCV